MSNLVYRAAQLLRDAAAVSHGAALTLRKRIPAAAGLGGGSADAAAALVGLRRLWGIRQRLAPLAEQLGSDVPYFLGTSAALVRGRGEILVPLPPIPARPVVLLRPPVALATRDVFAALSSAEWTDGAATYSLADALRREAPPNAGLLRNSLLAAAERCCPVLGVLRRSLAQHGVHAHLSGSGPTLFVFAETRQEAADVADFGRRLGADVWVCRTIRRRPLRVRTSIR